MPNEYITKKDQTQTTHVRYNHVRKTWQSINGRTTDYGPGPGGKRAATLAAIWHDAPDVARAVHALGQHHCGNEQVVQRLIKAARLVIDGLVFVGEIRSATDAARFYRVAFNGMPREYQCTCEDFRSGRAPRSWSIGGRVCKHALAQHLSFLMGLELSPPPVPFDGETTNVVDFDDIYNGGTEGDFDTLTEIGF